DCLALGALRDRVLTLLCALGLCLLERARFASLIDVGSHRARCGRIVDRGLRCAGDEKSDAGRGYRFHVASPGVPGDASACCISVTPGRDEPVGGEDGSDATPLTPEASGASHVPSKKAGRDA